MKINILGIRGIPAKHGGFETFAEKLALYLQDRGWDVLVYCHELGDGKLVESQWKGIKRIHIPVKRDGAAGTVIFDYKATIHALSQDGLFLTLGYNTAIFNLLQRIKGQTNVINMDGIEWRRDKWGAVAKTWFWLNERAGCWIGNHLVADHPSIKDHLATRVNAKKITMIPYGGDEVINADARLLSPYGIEPGKFSVIIARPEPENSFLEMVRAFSRSPRNHKLVVLGNFTPASNTFHRQVMEAANEEVIFPGAIYEAQVVQALRFHSRFYLHGHRVGGTNPSLVEAMGAGCAVIAHENHFNRWVAGPDAAYFKDESACAALFDHMLTDNVALERMKASSRARFRERFTWDQVLRDYEELLTHWHPTK
ncbi:glycosyl transferase [Stutzerimonas stutzeri]|jgi:glycosyltransferase involved in cell wall biosynthesis|nr:glycosyl transferase [Stutzerimonas stutzeri]AZO89384.1 glycosyl transferase [Stutzerimonas stutzeri]